MRSSFYKSSKAFLLPLMLLLTVAFSIFYCSKPELGEIVKEHIKAVNEDDVEKNLGFFADDIVFEIFDEVSLSGKDQLRRLMESDVVNKARLTVHEMQVEGDTVIATLTEKNEGYRLLGSGDAPFRAIYKFQGRLLKKVKLEGTPEGAKDYDEKYQSFAEWADKEHPREFRQMEGGLPSADNSRLFLSLLKLWRDETSIEGAAEQELGELENSWLKAFFKNDGAFAARFLAEDYIGTDEHGNVKNKAQEISEIRTGAHLSTSGVLDNIKIRVYGDAAVVTGRRIMKGLFQGKEYRSPYLWTDTFIMIDGSWQCVASHVSKAAGKIAPSAAIR